MQPQPNPLGLFAVLLLKYYFNFDSTSNRFQAMSTESQPKKTGAGRPSDYCQGTAAIICERLADGDSIRTICKEEDMPASSTVYRWLADPANVEFREQYARAREAQADQMADEILEIADDSSHDTMQTDFGPRADSEWISRSKLRVDARFKLMALLAPKKYGTKLVDVTSGGQQLQGIQLVDFDGSPITDVQ